MFYFSKQREIRLIIDVAHIIKNGNENLFQKLANLRQAITIEQKHLEELYQINETANTLSALFEKVDYKVYPLTLDKRIVR